MQKYALGCTFKLTELFYNFQFSKLQITCKECNALIKSLNRDELAAKIFSDCIFLVIDDIIERNVTFWFPLVGNKKCNMHMKRSQGKEFQQLRRGGKWQDVDFLKSNFSGYEIGFYMFGKRTPRVKTVYVNNKIKDRITKYTNEGKTYGDGAIDTKIADYYQQLFDLYPKVPKQDIKRILNFAWKSLYLHNSYGGDVSYRSTTRCFYIGNLKKDPVDHFNYYVRKMIVKLRVYYKRKQIPWDGYYYFSLNEQQYQEYIKQKKTKGRPKKYFKFNSVFLYKILDECRLQKNGTVYIFRLPAVTYSGIRYYRKELIANPELIEVRPPFKFKDILVSSNEYEFL